MGLLDKLNSFLTIEDNSKIKESELIKRIHRDFDTEVDRLLKQAKISRPQIDIDSNLEYKASRLSRLGFVNAQEVQKMDELNKRSKQLQEEQLEKDKLIETINYFSFKYPNYKFITREGIIKICKKYGLVYSNVENYIGNVPEKNIQHIENFKIDDVDKVYEISRDWSYTRFLASFKEVSKLKELSSVCGRSESITIRGNFISDCRLANYNPAKPLLIAANVKDFKKGMVSVNYQLQDVPDPVVFHRVWHNHKEYYLIVTAWGDEASDELVVNQKWN